MCLRALVSLSVVTCLSILPAAAQSPRADALRQKIDALQQELDEVDVPAKRYSHVTQIGGPRGAERREDQVVRLYDLSDLFAVAPPYTAERFEGLAKTHAPLFPRPTAETSGGGGMGGMGMGGGMGGGGFFSLGDKHARLPEADERTLHQRAGGATGASAGSWASMDDLIQAITSTISPASWDEVGGPGSIARLGNALLISSTRQNHEQIDALLQLFRQRWGTLRTISVRAWWLWLDEGRVAALLAGGAPAPKGAALPKGEGVPAFGVVDAALWDQVLAELTGPNRPEAVGYRASLTCYNGQTVSTQTARQSLLVTDIQPQVLGRITEKDKDKETSQPIVVYQPSTTIVQEGAALQITPISNTSGKYVVLDVHSQVTELMDSAPQAAAPAAGGEAGAGASAITGPATIIAALDRRRLAIQQLATTLRVPADKVMLIGGMTSDDAPDNKRPNLFLFVKVTVQELRDDRESREMPAAPADGKAAPDNAAPPSGAPDKSAPRGKTEKPTGGDKPAADK